MNTPIAPIESAEEKMLRQLGFQLHETARAIFGSDCRVELNITGAPVSKVAFIQEQNKHSAAGAHRVLLKQEDKFCVTVCDTNYLPF